jgi:tight adherence protein B
MPIAIVAIFAVTFLIIFGAYWAFVLRPEEAEGQAVRKRLKARKTALLGPIVKSEARLSSVGPIEQLLARFESLADPLRSLIERSGLKMTVGTLVLATIFAAVGGYALVILLTRVFVAAIVTGLFLSVVPFLYVKRAATKRVELFEEQFPEAVDLMARSLRAGHALTSALQMVGEEMHEPVGTEFRLLFDRQNFGMSLPDALREFGNRVPLVDARFFVTAVLIQRESGGNLSQVLDNLASVIRERFQVKREVRTMSAHGRITGWVLGVLPIVLAFVLFLIQPEHITLLLTTQLGIQMLTGAIVLQVVGVLIIRRIVDVEY